MKWIIRFLLKEVGRDDTLMSLLSTNVLSVNAYTRTNNMAPPIDIRQSFKTAAGRVRKKKKKGPQHKKSLARRV